MSSFEDALKSVEQWLEDHPDDKYREYMLEVRRLLIAGKEEEQS